MPTVLVLHDVYGSEGPSSTGFPGADADRYKLSRDQFGALLDIVVANGSEPMTVPHWSDSPDAASVTLTFDDGGVGAALHTADLLEARGWCGYFMIVTDRLGEPGFMVPAQVRELHSRGHVIGTHTRSHPVPISGLPLGAIVEEWAHSRATLEDLLGAEVRTGSVPAGFYSRQVGRAADIAGLHLLFTSEPVRRASRVGDCRLVGRYSVTAKTPPSQVSALLGGDLMTLSRAWLWWNVKKVIKSIGGSMWHALRIRILDR